MARPKRWRRVKILSNRAEIVLGNGGVALVDIEDVPKVRDYAWYMQARGHIRCRDGKRGAILLHRMIVDDVPEGLWIDHINRNPADNRKCNLRIATHAENMRNRPCLLGGVNYRKDNGKWRARIRVDTKLIDLGQYDTRDEALAARRVAEEKYFGAFAFRVIDQ